jgi:membrane associated rhomboid family serine protease
MSPSQALWGLIALNVAVHVAWLGAVQDEALESFMAGNFLVSIAHLAELRVWTLFTSAISHADSVHLLFNMLALWVFGADTAEVLGTRRFVGLYAIGGILASLGHLLVQIITQSPSPALGASGSVMAIAVVFAVLFPTRRLYIRGIIPAPAPIAVGGYVLLDVIGLVGPGDGVAHGAHLGGALYGLGYGLLARRRLVGRRPRA